MPRVKGITQNQQATVEALVVANGNHAEAGRKLGKAQATVWDALQKPGVKELYNRKIKEKLENSKGYTARLKRLRAQNTKLLEQYLNSGELNPMEVIQYLEGIGRNLERELKFQREYGEDDDSFGPDSLLKTDRHIERAMRIGYEIGRCGAIERLSRACSVARRLRAPIE